ncbi:hypothetical protein ANRL1_00164 [Anaerolineae bacterium]|nr:hypothetical protein ANRL1_00164 [Anaerolineae bacterium]
MGARILKSSVRRVLALKISRIHAPNGPGQDIDNGKGVMGNDSNARKPKVLIVEDDNDIASVVGLALEDFVDLTIAKTTGDAILAVRSDLFELVLLDWRLGNACGREVLQEIDFLDAESRPQVVITSGGNDDSLQEALQSSDCHMLPKPYMLDELTRIVARLLTKKNEPKTKRKHRR